MTHMAQQAVLVRISFLEGDIANIRQEIIATEDANELMQLRDRVAMIEERIDENRQWLRVLDKDPGFGILENVDGKYIPKMPTFKTPEEREYALEHRQHIRKEDDDTTPQSFMATREMVKREHTKMAIERMDGEGPIAAEDVE